MYKFNNGILPSLLNDMFCFNNNVHSQFTRQSSMLDVQMSNSMYVKIL